MDALNQLSPQALFFLQGAGQTSLTTSPGDGYVSDTATLQRYNLSDPSAFFKTLLVRPYVNQVSLALLSQSASRLLVQPDQELHHGFAASPRQEHLTSCSKRSVESQDTSWPCRELIPKIRLCAGCHDTIVPGSICHRSQGIL